MLADLGAGKAKAWWQCRLLSSMILVSCMQIEGLRRFMPQLLYIRQPGVLRDPAASPNTAVANSLDEVFAAT